MAHERPIYFSFFMFDQGTPLYDPSQRTLHIKHMKELVGYGYSGFELHIGRNSDMAMAFPSYTDELAAYRAFREQIDAEGLQHVHLATNVGATPELDPSSNDNSVRDAGLEFLRSRVDITQTLRGQIMMGPVVIPYGAFVHRAPNGELVWSDALQDELDQRYSNAQRPLEHLGEHADASDVNIAIEPIAHWETPGPNTLAQLVNFLKTVNNPRIGAVIDSAHETLDGAGPQEFTKQIKWLADEGRLHYAQASPPDRGTLESSWLPWELLFRPLLAHYSGPVAIEIFNAIPAFARSLRLSRRKYWIPGVDEDNGYPSAYQVAKGSLEKLQGEFRMLDQ